MEEDSTGEIADLYEKIENIEIKGRDLKALVTCNLARLLYLEWYHRSEPHDPDQMEELFKQSLSLNEKDPFTHCWYGTFLKEVRKDFQGAHREYKQALTIGNQSKYERLHEHPLFLNNIALLIMDEVQKRLCSADSLQEAKALLERAVKRVEEIHSDFFWPKDSLTLCLELLTEAGLTHDSSG